MIKFTSLKHNMNTLIKILRWIWELPQCLLGLILTKIYKVKYKDSLNQVKIYSGKFPGGISLGLYILLSESNFKYSPNTIKHEYGHTRQSLYLGPLYLIIIGLPSIIWAAMYGNIIKKTKNGYYKFYTEKWADKLGNVKR